MVRTRAAVALVMLALSAVSLTACGSSSKGLQAASPAGPAVTVAVPALAASPGSTLAVSLVSSRRPVASPAQAQPAKVVPPAPKKKPFAPLVKDPKLAWKQPAGLKGDDAAAVAALHHFYLHYAQFLHTANLRQPGFLVPTVVSPRLALFLLSELAVVKQPQTGTLAITVQSASKVGTTQIVRDCYDQKNIFAVGKNGKPILTGGSGENHIEETWAFTRSHGLWIAQAVRQVLPCA